MEQARRRLDNLLDALELGIEMRTLAPRIKAAQEKVDSLEALASLDTVAEHFPTRDEVALLLEETGANFRDLFGAASDPAK